MANDEKGDEDGKGAPGFSRPASRGRTPGGPRRRASTGGGAAPEKPARKPTGARSVGRRKSTRRSASTPSPPEAQAPPAEPKVPEDAAKPKKKTPASLHAPTVPQKLAGEPGSVFDHEHIHQPMAPSPWDNSLEFEVPASASSPKNAPDEPARKVEARTHTPTGPPPSEARTIRRDATSDADELTGGRPNPALAASQQPTTPRGSPLHAPPGRNVRKREIPVRAPSIPMRNDAGPPEIPVKRKVQVKSDPTDGPTRLTEGCEDWRRSPWRIDKPHTFLRGMAILSMLVLFEVWALPQTAADLHLQPPWELVTQTGSLTFLAAVAFGVLLLLTALPMPTIVRAGIMTLAGGALLVYGLIWMRASSDAFAFRGHPLVSWVFAGEPGVIAMLLASLWLPTALFWRARYTPSFASRIAVVVGAAVAVVAYLLLGTIGGGDGDLPLVALLSAVGDSDLLMGDRVAAVALLVPAAVLPLLLALVFLRHPRTGLSALWGWLFVTALAAGPLIQAGFVAGWRAGGWKSVLAPLEVSLFLYAGLLVAPVALGHLIGEIERQVRFSRAKKQSIALP